ncbi:putative peptidoglycan biosynthesis protein MviN [Brevibacterium ravenspurgense]|uniref:Putative peptidoglycan biosynthesis protein MviN n=1 Tax=Brevibacterium ravenspurgense TaxID=479117 RepID=A0A150H5L6_9MICO|nr:murein biosynthesis integral membrane protein MurJ [Brevibacterium ravenspurgense]KXZ57409.1 putative peptidoglycan biosynthesis protein MviN [Brevibacterium ravenspurgense]
MSTSKAASFAKSSAIMGAGTLVSRILGLAKTMLLTVAIGVTIGGAADAFDVANKIPNNLYMLLAGGVLNAVLVPQIVRAAEQPDGGKDYTDRLLTLSILLLGGLTIIATAAAPVLIWLYSSSTWSAEQTSLAVAFAFWCLPQLFFYGLYTMLGQVLNANSSFGPYMWAPVLNNVVAIAGLIVFIWMFGPGSEGQHPVGEWTGPMIVVLAGSATLGVVSQALVLIWPLKRMGFRYTPRFNFRGVGLGTAARVAGWTFGALVVGQLGFLVISRAAALGTSQGGEVSASNAAYTISYLIFMLPHSLVAVSLATALFTPLSKYAAADDTAAVKDSFRTGVNLVGLVNMFFTAAFIALAGPAAMVVGGAGFEQARALSLVIIAMIIGLVPFSANYLLQRVFYAYEDAKTPFWINLPQVVLTSIGVILSALFLPRHLIVAGIGLSMSTGYTIAMLLSFILLHKKIGNLGGKRIVFAHLKFAVAAALSGVIGAFLLSRLGDFWASRATAFITAAGIGMIMLIIYFGICWALRVPELRSLITTVRAKLGR